MPEFKIRTLDYVEGNYTVYADTEAEARAKFDRQPGRLIDFEGVTQDDYMAFEVTVQDCSSTGEGDDA